jgi:Fe-S-cluster containining protein
LLSLDKIYVQLSYAEKHGLLDELQNVYHRLPHTTCEKCATCCTVPSPAYIVEYLNMFRYMKSNLQDKIPGIIERSIRFYFLELVDINRRCPFVDPADNTCLVYPVRPFTCRGYGLFDKGEVPGAQDEMIKLAEKYKNEFNITLPDEVVNYKLPRCGKVMAAGGKKIVPELLEISIADVARLESGLFPIEIVDSEYTFVPFPTHLALTILGEGARARRHKVMKEYLEQGRSLLLDGYVDKYSKYIV